MRATDHINRTQIERKYYKDVCNESSTTMKAAFTTTDGTISLPTFGSAIVRPSLFSMSVLTLLSNYTIPATLYSLVQFIFLPLGSVEFLEFVVKQFQCKSIT